MIELLSVSGLVKRFPVRRGFFSKTVARVHAVEGVSFRVGQGSTVGLVGESGCGKSTVGRLVARLYEPDEGEIVLDGRPIHSLQGEDARLFRRKVQMIFQDPFASLNPRMRIGEIVTEPLAIHERLSGREKRERGEGLLEQVGLSPDSYGRYPHEFSGGQRQRIGIARAIALLPPLIIADEPVAALDVSVGGQIINLLQDLQERHRISFLFISHDLKMVRHVSHQVLVMYLGKIVEVLFPEAMDHPLHPYTQALVSAIPIPDPSFKRRRTVLTGEVPSAVSPPSGCAFHTRCPFAEARCREEAPELKEWRKEHWAACHLADKIS